jgi:hypothetical protein
MTVRDSHTDQQARTRKDAPCALVPKTTVASVAPRENLALFGQHYAVGCKNDLNVSLFG